MTDSTTLPPRWIIRAIWRGHRTLVRLTGGRLGLRRPESGKRAGMMQLHTVGRRSGVERAVMVCYFEDGDDLITLAMNGWSEEHPAWWLNLLGNPDASVDLPTGPRRVTARAAAPEERARLWPGFALHPGWGDIDAFVARRTREAPVVILSPQG